MLIAEVKFELESWTNRNQLNFIVLVTFCLYSKLCFPCLWIILGFSSAVVWDHFKLLFSKSILIRWSQSARIIYCKLSYWFNESRLSASICLAILHCAQEKQQSMPERIKSATGGSAGCRMRDLAFLRRDICDLRWKQGREAVNYN